MAIFAIGDLQGCYNALQRLLEKIAFDPATDTLWLTGDLVNRGPQSLAVLRFIYHLGSQAITVLGNHDLSLLAVAEGFAPQRSKDTWHDILRAPDRDELLNWLRHQPLLHYDASLQVVLVHAGIAPFWTLSEAKHYTAEVATVLQSPHYREVLAHLFGNQPDLWDDQLTNMDRIRCIVNYCTRMRFCDVQGRLDFTSKGAPGTQPTHLMPWFAVPHRRYTGTVIFGHWAALGFYQTNGIYALDSGCVWGQQLTALRIDQQPYLSTQCDCVTR